MESSQIITGAAICTVLIWLGFNSLKQHYKAVFSNQIQTDLESFIPYRIRLCRLMGGFLMLILALMLGFAMVYLEEPAQHLADLRDQSEESNTKLVYTTQQLKFATSYAFFWIVFLTVLLLLVATSSIDAIFSWKHQKQLRDSLRSLSAIKIKNINSQKNHILEETPPSLDQNSHN